MPVLDALTFQAPATVRFGFGLSAEAGAALAAAGLKSALIVTDKGVARAGILDGVQSSLTGAGLRHQTFAEVEPNPSVATVEKALDVYLAGEFDGLVAVGGGSPMDTAKAVGILATNGGRIGDYEGLNRVRQAPAPLAAIPTTAGTGSEVTAFCVITDPARRFKMPVVSNLIIPRWVFADPQLTVGLPPGITASTGMDALTHAIESYTNKTFHPIADCLALEAIRLIGRHLRTAVADGADPDARYWMLLASMLAGLAFTHTRLGMAHALAHPLGGFFDIPHGLANAVLLPHVLEFNLRDCLERSAEVAEALGETVAGLSTREAAERAVPAVRALSRDIGIPTGLKELGVATAAIPAMARDAMTSANIHVNPRTPTLDDIINLYTEAM